MLAVSGIHYLLHKDDNAEQVCARVLHVIREISPVVVETGGQDLWKRLGLAEGAWYDE